MIIKHVLKIHIAMHRVTCFSELYLGHLFLDLYICLPALVLHLSRASVTSDHHSLTMRYFHCTDLPRLFSMQ
jgi:hypothetical protein